MERAVGAYLEFAGVETGQREVIGILGAGPADGAPVFPDVPIDEATVAPIGDVLLGDRLSLEMRFEDGADVVLRVEPRDEDGGRLTIEEAGVEFLPDGLRKAGDFAVSSRHRGK